MSSILLERRGAFLAGTASSVLHFAHMDLGYFHYIKTTTTVWPELSSLQYIISLNIFGFCSVAFLSNFLAESWQTHWRRASKIDRNGCVSPGVQRPRSWTVSVRD